jgi:hypothetical protein
MQKLHFYFFCFYNFIYKDGFEMQNYRKAILLGRRLPEDRTIIGLWVSTYLWTFVIRLMIVGLFNPHPKILFVGYYECLIAFIIYSAYYFYFIDNDRFNDIYCQYRFTDKILQRQALRKMIIFLGLPIILIPLFIWIISTFTTISLRNQIIIMN